MRIYGVCQEHILRRRFFGVYFSDCVIGYEEKTANGKIQKEQEQSEAQPDGA